MTLAILIYLFIGAIHFLIGLKSAAILTAPVLFACVMLFLTWPVCVWYFINGEK
jgi:hypothetical protein